MKTPTKISKRGRGKRPYKTYFGVISLTDKERDKVITEGKIIIKPLSWWERFINWVKSYQYLIIFILGSLVMASLILIFELWLRK